MPPLLPCPRRRTTPSIWWPCPRERRARRWPPASARQGCWEGLISHGPAPISREVVSFSMVDPVSWLPSHPLYVPSHPSTSRATRKSNWTVAYYIHRQWLQLRGSAGLTPASQKYPPGKYSIDLMLHGCRLGCQAISWILYLDDIFLCLVIKLFHYDAI